MTPQKKRHYSIRKLRAGVGSILIGTTLLFGLSTQLVQANTTADSTTTSDSAGGTTAAPGVTTTGTNTTPTPTATGGGTATEEKPKVEKPKVEEPTEKPVEETPKETAPKVEDKKEAETPNAPTNPADHPMVKELEKLLKEVEELPKLESTDYFKEQINIWNEQKELAKKRLDIAKKGENTEKVEGFLGDYVQYANIEKMARHAQQLYKKHASSTEMLDLIKKAFGIGKDKDTYASLEGSHLVTYVNDDVIGPYNKIVELARKLDEEKAKKEKEKEQPAPAPAPEEPKKEEEKPTPAPTPEEPKKEEKPAPAPAPEEPKKEEEKPTPAPTPEPKKEEEKPAPEPKKDTEKPADPKEPEVPKKDETPAPTPEPKKDTEKPAPSQPKQDDSMKKDYKLFYQTKDKTEEVDFKGTPEELKATLDKAIEKYKQNGYPYVDRFERENRILLVFNQHKSIIVLETNGDGGSRQSRPFYGTPQELEAEIKKLTENLSDTYKIEKKEGYDKLDPTVKTITLVLTKLSDTPKETPAPKKEDKPTPPKDEKQTQPEDKKPEQPKKDEKQTQPEDKKPEQPKKDEKQTQPEGKKAEKPKDEKQTQ
ncbi:GAG-binding domain-containing protein, partial [Streptococcus ruminantium]|uniref:GAG-binding domain-containing protein n=1 Tax=Streptococcus ruminantium TaxID=1917441 RepID=UPI001D141170